MKISLRQLSVFQAVAQGGRVTCAAEKLFMSQPAASMALSELEKQLDCQLFDRQGNRLVLNDRGRTLLPLGNEILTRAAEIEQLFSTSDAMMHGHLKIGASTTIGNYLLPNTISSFVEDKPDVRVSLEIANTDEIIGHLLHFRIGAAFVEGLCQHPDIEVIPWHQDHLVVVASAKHPLAKERNISIEQLINERWILREVGSGTRAIFQHAVSGKLDNLKIHMELNHTEAIKQAVSAGLGVSCLSSLTIERAVSAGDICVLDINDLDLSRNLSLLIHRKKYRSGLLQSFLDYSLNSKPEAY